MSALIIVAKSASVDLLTDAAHYAEGDGVLRAIETKQIPIPELQCVLAARGHASFGPVFARVASEWCRSFDELAHNYLAMFAHCMTAYPRGQLAVAGWSESRDRPEAYLVMKRDAGVTGGKTIGYFGGGPKSIKPFAARFLADPESFDAETHGVEAMEIMRRGAEVTIGGFVEVTTVTRQGFLYRVVHEWPDRIGHSIQLEAA